MAWTGSECDSSLAQGKILVLEHSVPGRWQCDVLFKKVVEQRGLAEKIGPTMLSEYLLYGFISWNPSWPSLGYSLNKKHKNE